MTRLFVVLAALASLMMMASGASAEDSRYGKQKVVYHINYNGGEEDKAYRGAMRNIQNHINAVGKENLDVKVVLHGNGVSLLKNAKQNEKLQQDVLNLKSQNVGFHVCNNTLTGRNISYENDLFEVWEEDIVPSGVAELSRLQQMGYTYIKP
ncbi:DsrE family protein [Notoacmeibacter sp. MSK16QG-6]|uniref:DsrE family protein n=1 Tax=Notoacmeibacter sp. MSK16QG-6 TaxID=2957982 RepID=UPI00209F5D9C|nr:DsrE family protein [Notoacmeibacter sp. MSK16QG-6]MCP1200014.1 DsrE family protein [Notoacmeibacter sp. MSK16QG-6]